MPGYLLAEFVIVTWL